MMLLALVQNMEKKLKIYNNIIGQEKLTTQDKKYWLAAMGMYETLDIIGVSILREGLPRKI